jgi:hypothetical protein
MDANDRAGTEASTKKLGKSLDAMDGLYPAGTLSEMA